MNVKNIVPGEDYAWVDYRQRGVFPRNATRVTVLSVSTHKYPWNKNATGKVKIQFTGYSGKVRTKEVEARKIIDYWDDYEAQRESVISREKQQAEERKVQIARRNQEVETLKRYLSLRLGIPPHAIVSVTPTTVNLSRPIVESLVDVKYDVEGQMKDTLDANG